jgi:hypothetical protein
VGSPAHLDIHEDTGFATPDSTRLPAFEQEHDTTDAEDEDDADDGLRRESGCTAGSISTLPESAWQTDIENGATHKPYTPPVMRPAFLRAEDVRRMRMHSPAPSMERSPRSPRMSELRREKRDGSGSAGRGSPKGRRRAAEEEKKAVREEEAKRQYPLVLLHITVMPVRFPWSAEVLDDVLPEEARESLRMLRTKITETVLKRGLLVPHPGEDYETLMESLREALDLPQSHPNSSSRSHKPRRSTGSVESLGGSDSGLGSSVEGADEDDREGELCAICRHKIFGSRSSSNGDRGDNRWEIKVYAANGLMRAPAWAAVWNEMERVDVEILPWMSEEVVRRLSEKTREKALRIEVAERHVEEEGERGQDWTSGEMVLREADVPTTPSDGEEIDIDSTLLASHDHHHNRPSEVHQPPERQHPEYQHCDHYPSQAASAETVHNLPRIYRRSEVPIQVLLRNYFILLVQDRKNVAIFFLSILVFWLGWRCSEVLLADISGKSLAIQRHVVPEAHHAARSSAVPTNIALADRDAADFATAFGVPVSAPQETVSVQETGQNLDEEAHVAKSAGVTEQNEEQTRTSTKDMQVSDSGADLTAQMEDDEVADLSEDDSKESDLHKGSPLGPEGLAEKADAFASAPAIAPQDENHINVPLDTGAAIDIVNNRMDDALTPLTESTGKAVEPSDVLTESPQGQEGVSNELDLLATEEAETLSAGATKEDSSPNEPQAILFVLAARDPPMCTTQYSWTGETGGHGRDASVPTKHNVMV